MNSMNYIEACEIVYKVFAFRLDDLAASFRARELSSRLEQLELLERQLERAVCGKKKSFLASLESDRQRRFLKTLCDSKAPCAGGLPELRFGSPRS